MREFRKFREIDSVSEEFEDPLTLSHILLRQKIVVANKKAKFNECMKVVKSRALEYIKKKNVLYVIIKHVNDQWSIRSLIAGGTILALLYENREENVKLRGSLAFENLSKELYQSNPEVKYTLGIISIEQLPENIRVSVSKLLEGTRENEPPQIWFNKYLYDVFIEGLISEKGGYMYVLLGRDKLNNKYAVKIPREKTVDGKPLATSTDPSVLAEVLKGALNSLEVSLMTREDLKRGLSSLGYDEVYAENLLYYRKYILSPRAIIIFKNMYTSDEYVEIPPMILEEYANMGDLDRKVKRETLNHREVAFIAVRLSGALALIHTARFIHMDIKPHNVLLVVDDSEPYGYSPLLSDFVGSPHVFDSYIELRKSTPEYADPIALIKGRASFSYDVYGLGATLLYAATGKKLRGRVLANLVALKNLYGVLVPLKPYLLENPDLTNYFRSLDDLYNGFKNKKISYQEMIESIESIVEEIDSETFKELNEKLPEKLANIIRQTLTLDETNRYSDGVALWMDLLEAVKDLGYTNLIPLKRM